MKMPELSIITKNLPDIQDITYLEQGGQKIVYRGTHKTYGSIVLKLILNPSASERIQREIDVATKGNFPNVPKLYEWGSFTYEDGQTIYLIEQYIPGQTLRNYLNVHKKLPLDKALELLGKLLETAVELEKQQLVHRDIKPENIIVSDDGSFWLLDFGIARHLKKTSITATEAHFGPHTPGYASPEQFRNVKKEVDIRADLFSIGVLIYEAIAGEHPFVSGARDHLDILRRTEALAVNFLVIPEDSQKQLGGFINILMSKYPSRRPKTARIALDWYYALLPTIRFTKNKNYREDL